MKTKTTTEIVDYWDEGDNDDNHKDKERWINLDILYSNYYDRFGDYFI